MEIRGTPRSKERRSEVRRDKTGTGKVTRVGHERETLNLTEIEEEIRAQANTGEKDEDKESQDWRRATTKDRTRDE